MILAPQKPGGMIALPSSSLRWQLCKLRDGTRWQLMQASAVSLL
jgi:hypothetical protein